MASKMKWTEPEAYQFDYHGERSFVEEYRREAHEDAQLAAYEIVKEQVERMRLTMPPFEPYEVPVDAQPQPIIVQINQPPIDWGAVILRLAFAFLIGLSISSLLFGGG